MCGGGGGAIYGGMRANAHHAARGNRNHVCHANTVCSDVYMRASHALKVATASGLRATPLPPCVMVSALCDSVMASGGDRRVTG